MIRTIVTENARAGGIRTCPANQIRKPPGAVSPCKRITSMKRIVNALGQLNWSNRACAVFVLCATTAIALPAQTFTRLVTFDGTDGLQPDTGLVQATDGNLYGATFNGGAYANNGTVFKITPSGTLTTIYSFCSQSGCLDGSGVIYAALVQATNGDFYGTT